MDATNRILSEAIFLPLHIDHTLPLPPPPTDPKERLKYEIMRIDKWSAKVKTNITRVALQEAQKIKARCAEGMKAGKNGKENRDEVPVHFKNRTQGNPTTSLTPRERQEFITSLKGPQGRQDRTEESSEKPDFSAMSPIEQARWEMMDLVRSTKRCQTDYKRHVDKQKRDLEDEHEMRRAGGRSCQQQENHHIGRGQQPGNTENLAFTIQPIGMTDAKPAARMTMAEKVRKAHSTADPLLRR
jgi:hypothetical protein